MATSKIKGLDEALLEGGGGGGGAGIGGTKWSNIPSFKGKSNTLSDINKMMSETSHLKGGAKQAVEEAKARAANRTAVRAAGAATVGAGAKSMMPESATAKDSSSKDKSVDATFSRVTEESPEAGEMASHYKPDNYKKGGKVTASSRADGIAQRGKTRGKMC